MSTVLEQPLGPITVEDWLAMDPPDDGSRLELIYGHLHVSAAPTGLHQYAGDELREVLKYALRNNRRSDLYAVTGVGVKVSLLRRIGLIPDVVIMKVRPVDAAFEVSDVVLVAETWSRSNRRAERETKMAEYARAGVPYFWAVTPHRMTGATVTAYYLKDGRYVEELTAKPGTTVTIKAAAPVPVTFDPADLNP